MERIGLFTPHQEKFLAQALKSAVKAKGKFMKWIMAYAILYIVKGLDNFALDRIGANWKVSLYPIIDTAMAGEYEQCRRYVTDLLSENIDFKRTSQETELRLFDALTRFLAAAIDHFIEQKQLNK